MLGTSGSTPRDVGAKCVITRAALHDSIGGGGLEHLVTAAAREMLTEENPAQRIEHFPLGQAAGQCCGGAVAVLLEPITPTVAPLALFGAGHVGRALVRILRELPFHVIWIDARRNEFPEAVPSNVDMRVAADPLAEIERLPSDRRARNDPRYDLDRRLVAALLRRSDSAFVGLIASEVKARGMPCGRRHRRGPPRVRESRRIAGHSRQGTHGRRRFDRGPVARNAPIPARAARSGFTGRHRLARIARAAGAFTRMNIKTFDGLPADEAVTALRSCCESERWARAVIEDRPYGARTTLLDAAAAHWAQADEAELLTAFAAHPRIGDIELLRARYATGSATANAEQGQVLAADDAVLERLRDQNDAYFERFGFIFIVCATGKSASRCSPSSMHGSATIAQQTPMLHANRAPS